MSDLNNEKDNLQINEIDDANDAKDAKDAKSIPDYSKMSNDEKISYISTEYNSLFLTIYEKLKYHDILAGSLENDFQKNSELFSEKNILTFISDNFLFCLESIVDHNSDYFIYQKDKIKRKNGKYYKNKLSKIGDRTLLKKVLEVVDADFANTIFDKIIELFEILTEKNENDLIVFNKFYKEYVKNELTENKNFSKMLMVIDNLNSILDNKMEEFDEVENKIIEKIEDKKLNSKKKSKKSKSSNSEPGMDFLKGLENTKIAQLAKNISEKINLEDFPDLSDPSKLLSSLGNPSSQEGGGIQNLLKFVVGEVEEAFKGEKINEKDLVNEAQDIMGKFQNMSGFDPASFLKNNKNMDMSQFADIFSKMKK